MLTSTVLALVPDFSHRRPPPVSDHFVQQLGWSLTRELCLYLLIYTEHSRLEKMRSSFLRVGPKIWNSLPSDMRNLPKSTFRKKLRSKLFEILSKSDDYLEITEIVHQLKFN